MLFYPAALPLSARPLPTSPGSSAVTARTSGRAGANSTGRQALLVLAYLRRGDTFVELAAGSGTGCAGELGGRYWDRTSDLLGVN
jgi:hypothetical protein